MLSELNQLIQDIDLVQTTINQLYSLIGYGTAAEPQHSGETLAFQWAREQDEIRTVFDVGAHEGEWVREMSAIEPDARYYSFEPQSLPYDQLFNLAFKYFPNMCPVYSAVSTEDGIAQINTHIDGAANASLARRDLAYLGVDYRGGEWVYTTRLDTFCQRNRIDRIDFLKLDVEGWEFSILESSIDMIRANRIKYIQFEYGSCQVDTRSFLKDFYHLLRPFYHFYRVTPRGLYPCNDYREEFECFNLANYLLRYNPENEGWK